ncbi:unnamed protein product, partial [Mesorhabditis spiculigera]
MASQSASSSSSDGSSSATSISQQKDQLYFIGEQEFWEPIQDEYIKKIAETPSEDVYPSFNPGPTKADGSMNFECHCVGHLVASPCGFEFRNVITCQKKASDADMEAGACADEMMAFMDCAMRTECFKAAKGDGKDGAESKD